MEFFVILNINLQYNLKINLFLLKLSLLGLEMIYVKLFMCGLCMISIFNPINLKKNFGNKI